MNSNIIKMKLVETAKRINTLKARFSYIKENGKLEEYSGFVPGQYSVSVMSPLWDISEKERDEFREWLSTKFCTTDNEYLLEYHLSNVDCVISGYFHGLVDKKFEIDQAVVDNFIEACDMVEKTVSSIISNL